MLTTPALPPPEPAPPHSLSAVSQGARLPQLPAPGTLFPPPRLPLLLAQDAQQGVSVLLTPLLHGPPVAVVGDFVPAARATSESTRKRQHGISLAQPGTSARRTRLSVRRRLAGRPGRLLCAGCLERRAPAPPRRARAPARRVVVAARGGRGRREAVRHATVREASACSSSSARAGGGRQ